MVIYLVIFGSSVGLIYMAEQSFIINRGMSKLVTAWGLLLPALLAGLRDYSIGTDILTYGNSWFELAVRSGSIFQYFSQAIDGEFGLLYALFNYVVSRVSDSPHVFYFFYALTEITIVYFGAKKADVSDIPFAMFVYYCVFYNLSYNILRQSMAVVIILFGFRFVKKNQFVFYLITVIIASLFHISAVIGIILYVIHIFANRENREFWQRILILGCIVATLFASQILDIILWLNLVGTRYVHYLIAPGKSGSWRRILFFGAIAILLFFFSRREKHDLIVYDDFKIYVVCSILFSILGFRFGYFERIVYYFDILIVIGIPLLVENIRIRVTVGRMNCTKLFFVVYLLFYWFYTFVYKGYDETIPYVLMTF